MVAKGVGLIRDYISKCISVSIAQMILNRSEFFFKCGPFTLHTSLSPATQCLKHYNPWQNHLFVAIMMLYTAMPKAYGDISFERFF